MSNAQHIERPRGGLLCLDRGPIPCAAVSFFRNKGGQPTTLEVTMATKIDSLQPHPNGHFQNLLEEHQDQKVKTCGGVNGYQYSYVKSQVRQGLAATSEEEAQKFFSDLGDTYDYECENHGTNAMLKFLEDAMDLLEDHIDRKF